MGTSGSMVSSEREVTLERIARAIARVIALRSIQDDDGKRSQPFLERLRMADEMAEYIWRDVLMEAEAAMEAYPEPEKAPVQ